MISRILRMLGRDERGTALIEGALLTPMLFVVVFGVFEFAWYFYQQQAIEIGLRDAARYIARTAQSDDTSCGPNTDPNIWPNAQNLATTGSTAGGTARVAGWTAGQVNFTCLAIPNTDNYLGGDGTSIFVIQASTTFTDPSLGMLGFLGLGPWLVSVPHQERIIGPG